MAVFDLTRRPPSRTADRESRTADRESRTADRECFAAGSVGQTARDKRQREADDHERRVLLRQLRQRLGGTTDRRRPAAPSPLGLLLGRARPGHATPSGTVDLLADAPGVAACFAVAVAETLGGNAVWVEGQGREHPGRLFTPPRLDTSPCVVARPETTADALWAAEQALRCPTVRVVVAAFGPVGDVAGRRLQLAAEGGETTGLFLRPVRVARSTCWTDTRLRIEPVVGDDPEAAALRPRWRTETLYQRGGTEVGTVHDVELTDAGDLIPVVPQLAAAAVSERSERRHRWSLRRLA